ncbi:zinc-binding dehydrogenase [Agromyces laixinhei]
MLAVFSLDCRACNRPIAARYRIGEVAEAFRALESRSTTGKIVLEH